MDEFTTSIAPNMNAEATVPSKLTSSLRPENKLDIIEEDEEFLNEFNRVINNLSIKYA